MIMDGETMDVGAVAGLRGVRNVVGVARMVLERTTHSLIVGEDAKAFALEMGFQAEETDTEENRAVCEEWKRGGCQPNFRKNVVPDETKSCGPYKPLSSLVLDTRHKQEVIGHDTISMIALSHDGKMASATSTNGARHKIPGRVGDGPIAGSGSYVDSDVGGCGATGDGDVMMRFLPCYQAVENLRRGMKPRQAAEDAVRRMVRKFPDVKSGVIVLDKDGTHGAAASGWTFTYSYRSGGMNVTKVVSVSPVETVEHTEL